jgi:hypothetical protein
MFNSISSASEVFTSVDDILSNPLNFANKFVSVKGNYTGWKNGTGKPPVTRSDWVISGSKKGIYCTGLLPQNLNPVGQTKPICVLAIVKIGENNIPYLEVKEIKKLKVKVEKMSSVAQILFDPINSKGQYVGLLGVLAKGYGVKGDRMYLLADPTGAIKLGRLPKLFPKGTILHLRGVVSTDKNGLPFIDEVDIVSARVD